MFFMNVGLENIKIRYVFFIEEKVLVEEMFFCFMVSLLLIEV